MSYRTAFVALGLSAILLTGCSSFHFPGAHRFDIPQGNVVTQDMVDQLKPGMTKSQVRFIMGTPLLVDTFNQNRWDYYYSVRKTNGELEQEQVSVFFNEQDLLTGITGDYAPANASQSDG